MDGAAGEYPNLYRHKALPQITSLSFSQEAQALQMIILQFFFKN